MSKQRRDYVYVARRATKEDESYFTRNWKDECQFIIFRRGFGYDRGRHYLWIDRTERNRPPIVVLESYYVGGRNFHPQGSRIFKACEQAVNRLLQEEKELIG